MVSSNVPTGRHPGAPKHGDARLQGTQCIQPQPTQNTADGGWRDAGLSGDLLARPALATQPFDLLDNRLRRRPAQPMRPG
jgi:hypothetical protein